MAIIISNKAVQNINNDDSVLEPNYGEKLSCELFLKDNYLIQLAASSFDISSLTVGINSNSVRLVKIALNTLNQIHTEFNLLNSLDINSYTFDNQLELELKNFQIWANIQENGKIDSKTIIALDRKFKGNEIFDRKTQNYLGSNEKNLLKFKSINTNGNNFIYNIRLFENSEFDLTFEYSRPFIAYVLKKNNNDLVLIPDETFVNELKNNEQFIKYSETYPEIINQIAFVFLPEALKISFNSSQGEILISIETINDEIEKTPIVEYFDDFTDFYKVNANEDFSQLIINKYYNQETNIINYLYNENDLEATPNIYTLPNNSPLQNRDHDCRFHYYLNLLYYSNINIDNEDNVTEWGIKNNNSIHSRFNENHLNNFYLYDLDDEIGDDKLFPNYYRLLKNMENNNPLSKLTFDSNGKVNSYLSNNNSNIIIPSRIFADCFFYDLNFREADMLEVFTDDPPTSVVARTTSENSLNSEEDDETEIIYRYEYVNEASFQIFLNSIDEASGILDGLKEEFKKIYNEIKDFYKAAKKYILNSLSKYIPRGMGGYLERGLGVTWGLPVATDVNFISSISREVTNQDQFTLKFSETKEVKLGVDVAVGGTFGFHSGKNKKNKKIGFSLGAGIGSGIKIKCESEYQFPLRSEEKSLLSMAVTVFGGNITTNFVKVIDYFQETNLDPQNYLTKYAVGISHESNAWGNLSFNGTSLSDKNLSTSQPSPQTVANFNQNKNFAKIENIWKYFDGFGLTADAEICLGFEFSYTADYKSGSLYDKRNVRIPSDVALESTINIRGTTKVQVVGDWLKKIIYNLSPPGVVLNNLLKFLENDRGLLFKYKKTGTRIGLASNMNFNHFNLVFSSVVSQNEFEIKKGRSSGSIKYKTTTNPTWTWSAKVGFGTYSGEIDSHCEPSTKAIFYLDLYNIKNILNDSSYSFDSYEKAIKIFDSVELNKKMGYIFEANKKTKLNVPDHGHINKLKASYKRANNQDTEVYYTRKLLEVPANKIGLDFGSALEIGITLNFRDADTIVNILSFYYKVMILKSNQLVNQNELKNAIFDNKNRIMKVLAKKYKSETTNSNTLIAKKGITYFNDLYYFGTIQGTNQKGLNGWLLDNYQEQLQQTNFIKGLTGIIGSYDDWNKYLQNGLNLFDKEKISNGIHDLVIFSSYLSNVLDLNVKFEARLGLSGGGEIKVGEGATIRLAFSGAALIIYDASLIEKGQTTVLATDNSDVFVGIINEVKKTFNNTGTISKPIRAGSKLVLIQK